MRVTFDRGARLDDTRAFVTTRCVAIARGASRACSCGARARRPCTHHGCVCLGPLADRAKRARRRGRFDACVRPVLFDRRAGARAGTIRGGKSPRAARPRGDLCACLVRRDRVRACEKSPGGARFADTSSPNCYQSALFLAKTSVVRLPSPGVRRAHRRARSHASRLPGNFATRSRSPKRLTQDPRPARRQDHETSRGQRIRGRRAWVRGPRIPGWPRFRRPRRQGRQRRLRRRTSGYGRGCVPLFLLRFPRARSDRSADASSDAPLIPARRNCWFTLVKSGGARVKSAPPFPRSRLH